MKFTRKKFSGDYSDLEPHIDAQTMELHQEKHHEGYQNKLNAALEGVDHSYETIEEILKNLENLPADVQSAVVNNGGGLANHNLFFSTISDSNGVTLEGAVAEFIEEGWDSFDDFKEEFAAEASSLFGSGWVFLAVDENNGDPHISALPNQESPWLSGHKPLFGLDVWEHAYYLNYQNKRADYIEAFFNVIDWEKVNAEWEKVKNM